MRRWSFGRGGRRFVTCVKVLASEQQDKGVGIVICGRPLILLVPSHLIALAESGECVVVLVDEQRAQWFKVVASAVLANEHLTLLRVRLRTPARLRSVSLPRTMYELKELLPVSIVGCCERGWWERYGRIRQIRGQARKDAAITDIQVANGDSGSALMVHYRLRGVCQGKMPHDGDCAVAVPLTTESLREIRRLRNRGVTPFLARVALLAGIVLVAVGVVGHSLLSRPRLNITIPTRTTLWVAGNRERYWWETRNIEWGLSEMFSVEFSSDNGETWFLLAGVSNDGSDPFIVPDVSSDQCRIRMTSRSNPVIQAVSERFAIMRPSS